MHDRESWKAATTRTTDIDLGPLGLASRGQCYDLSSGWWHGMPMPGAHPPFGLMSFRTPQGQRVQKDMPFYGDNSVGFGFISELMSCTTHSGTHIDALAHVTCGADPSWHGDYLVREHLGDFGPRGNDASALPPIISRGVMLDIPGLLGVDHMAGGQGVDADMLDQACARQNVQIRPGDVVLLRTGTMEKWPDPDHLNLCHGAGLALDGAEWLVERGARAIGADNESLECQPSNRAGDPQPVHRFLIREQGISILEWVYLEDLAQDGISEFLFLCIPLPVTGATASMIRPLAIV